MAEMALKKKNTVGGISLPDFKSYIATVIKTWKKKDPYNCGGIDTQINRIENS